jgi:hypothetical protein
MLRLDNDFSLVFGRIEDIINCFRDPLTFIAIIYIKTYQIMSTSSIMGCHRDNSMLEIKLRMR